MLSLSRRAFSLWMYLSLGSDFVFKLKGVVAKTSL